MFSTQKAGLQLQRGAQRIKLRIPRSARAPLFGLLWRQNIDKAAAETFASLLYRCLQEIWVDVLVVLAKDGQRHKETKLPNPYQPLLDLLSCWGTAHSCGVVPAGAVGRERQRPPGCARIFSSQTALAPVTALAGAKGRGLFQGNLR